MAMDFFAAMHPRDIMVAACKHPAFQLNNA